MIVAATRPLVPLILFAASVALAGQGRFEEETFFVDIPADKGWEIAQKEAITDPTCRFLAGNKQTGTAVGVLVISSNIPNTSVAQASVISAFLRRTAESGAGCEQVADKVFQNRPCRTFRVARQTKGVSITMLLSFVYQGGTLFVLQAMQFGGEDILASEHDLLLAAFHPKATFAADTSPRPTPFERSVRAGQLLGTALIAIVSSFAILTLVTIGGFRWVKKRKKVEAR